MKLGQVMVFAKDLERMRRFYGDGVGLAVETEADGWIRFAAGGAFFALHAIPADIARTITIANPPDERSDTAIKFTFHVDDVDAARARLIQHGARMREPRRWSSGTAERVFCDGIDPEGNVFQIARG